MVWWQNAAIYQVYPRSFRDSNGDGEGDLNGVIAGLDYLESLGIDAIWLSPFYKTPNKDGGYDVSNPRDVDPRFGNLADAENLIRESHRRNIKIIVDIVPNHFSTEHSWFQEALNTPSQSRKRARFHFYDGRGESGEIPPNNWNSIFGGPAWTRIKESNGEAGQWYLHLFDSTQADLNWNNSDVKRDFIETLKFWLDLGVDGFRIDVAHGLVKGDIYKDHRDPEGLTRALRLDISDMSDDERESLLADVPFFDREEVHEIYQEWRKILDSYEPPRMTVAEAWVHPSLRATRYVRPNELHQIFNFDFLIAKWEADSLRASIEKTISELSTVNASPTWVLCNHDSPRVISRLGGGELGELKARALALIIHALPGGIYIYQGEELGLEDVDVADHFRQDPVFYRTNGAEKGRDGARVPLPWTSSAPFYGFSTAQPWLPMPNDWAMKSIEKNDFIKLYKNSLRIRSNHPALKRNLVSRPLNWLETENGVLGFSRDPGFSLYSNTTASEKVIDLPESENWNLILQSSRASRLERGRLHLSPNETCWLSKL